VDPDIFETVNELVDKLNTIIKSVKGQALKLMLDDEDNHNNKLPPSVMVALKEHDKKNDKIPFYLSSKNDALTSLHYDPQLTRTKNFGLSNGYIPKKDLRFGGTCGCKHLEPPLCRTCYLLVPRVQPGKLIHCQILCTKM
jgi:hypothetical protein